MATRGFGRIHVPRYCAEHRQEIPSFPSVMVAAGLLACNAVQRGLRPAVDAFARRADAADVPLHVLEVPAMFHVWMTRAIPEARRTRQYLVDAVRRLAG